MASISEDTGEETPLQVSFCFVFTCYGIFCLVPLVYTFDDFLIGTPKWGCNVHWNHWAYSSFCCFGCPSGEVNLC